MFLFGGASAFAVTAETDIGVFVVGLQSGHAVTADAVCFHLGKNSGKQLLCAHVGACHLGAEEISEGDGDRKSVV